MRGLNSLQRSAILLGAASLLLWYVVIRQMWADEPIRVLRAITPVAGTMSIIAAMMWIGGHNARRSRDASKLLAENNEALIENNAALIGTVDRVTRPAVPARRAGTGPLTLV